jgi:hypothetical protein
VIEALVDQKLFWKAGLLFKKAHGVFVSCSVQFLSARRPETIAAE